ncbi:MAG: dUTPase [Puniceicoccales bacterium]|jgi:dimeric dUTPase (all-alpha-NTP-PPase superfamily)|nr:dUTPase [Puniceicoccales bacterium]
MDNENCTGDMWKHMFILQKELGKRLGVCPETFSNAERITWVLNYTRALQQEVAELIDSLPWKWWAKYQKFDLQNARVEVVDLLHFLLAIAQALGMSSEDVYNAFLKKNAVNHARQDSGYESKNAEDSRHI